MKFDWTIHFGDAIGVFTMAGFGIAALVKVGGWQTLLKNFPLHRHGKKVEEITYPVGMEPK